MYNSCKAPVFTSYGQAKEWHDKVPPVRGRKISVRPLGARRYADIYSITMNGDDVVFLYGGWPVTVWHPDDSITIHRPKWCSAFEPDKLAHYLPPRLNFLWDKGRFILSNQCDGSSVEIKFEQPVRVKSVGVETMGGPRDLIVRKYETQNKPVVYKYEKRRGASQNIMQTKFAPFIDWVNTVAPILRKVSSSEHHEARDQFFHEVTGITPEEWTAAEKWNSIAGWDKHRDLKERFSHADRMRDFYPMAGPSDYSRYKAGTHEAGVVALYKMVLPENQNQWLNALQIIAGRCCKRTWNSRFDIFYELTKNDEVDEAIRDYVEELVCVVDRASVFRRTELPLGSIPNKRNEKYFTFDTFKFFEKTDTVSDISAY